jgi:hypothetical protein
VGLWPTAAMANVLSEEKRQQVVVLGRLGWPLRRIEDATGVRRETASAYLKAAGVPVRPPGGWGRRPLAKPANEASTDPVDCPKPANDPSTDLGPDAKPANEVSTDLAWPLPEPLTDAGGDAASAKGSFTESGAGDSGNDAPGCRERRSGGGGHLQYPRFPYFT